MKHYIHAFRLAVTYLNKYPMYWVWMSVRVLFVISEVCLPIILGHIINILTNQGSSWETVGLWATIYVVLHIINPMLEVWTAVQAWIIGIRAAHDFRQDTVELLKHTGLSFWQNKSKGSVMKIIDQAHSDFGNICATISHTYLWGGGRVLGVLLASSFFDPVIFAIYMIDIVLFYANLHIMIPIENRRGLIERKGQEDVTGRISEYLQNFKTVVYLNLFDRQERELREYNEKAYQKYRHRETMSTIKWYNNNQLHNIATVAVFCYGMYLVMQGEFAVGSLATLMIFSTSFSDNLAWLVWQSDQLIGYVNSVQRHQETFGMVKADERALIPTENVSFSSLSLKNVSLQREERETLTDVSLQINKGDKLAIVGYTGSGKSTLLDVILKVITDYEGEVSINHHTYRQLKVVDIANIFSVVPQEVQLFHDTVRNNILASNESFQGDLDTIIHNAGLTELIDRLPKGLDSVIHEGSGNISGGERQRIGIARSLVQEQPVLVLDEATASLDPRTERDVVTRIINEYPDQTMIYITHKYSLLNYFSHILVMNDGRIIESGSFKDLLSKGGLFKDLYEASQMQ
ncbi:MAG: ABC transporter ATP-binding protein [Patescibacteria group bacterium]